MRKKNSFIIVERASILVPEFKRVYKQLSEQVTLRCTKSEYLRELHSTNCFVCDSFRETV